MKLRMINQLKKSTTWLLFVWTMFCSVMIVISHPMEYQAEGLLLLGRQADLCVLKAGRPTELIGFHWQFITDLCGFTISKSAIHSRPCHSFLVDCSYNSHALMANVAGGRSIYWSTLKMFQYLKLLIVECVL